MSETFRYGKAGCFSVQVHEEGECDGFCPIHNPSEHPMSDFPLHWRSDRGLMERICPHGVGHPDPDHMARVERLRGKDFADDEGLHGCDGCCVGPLAEIEKGRAAAARAFDAFELDGEAV